MKHLSPRHPLRVILPAGLVLALVGPAPAGTIKPPKEPAKLAVSVSPEAVAPGESARVTVRLEPIPGVKINRYPKMKLSVEAREGLNGGAEVAVGNDKPPPPEKLTTNYYETVEPLELTIELDPAAEPGRHEIEGRVKYFYCVTASGYCAPARASVSIPVEIR
jgi:hypothetical protein